MLSEAAEFLLGALHGLRGEGLCPACAAKMLVCTRETMVKATKELIAAGSVLAPKPRSVQPVAATYS